MKRQVSGQQPKSTASPVDNDHFIDAGMRDYRPMTARYSLRIALLFVTLARAWLCWQASVVRERKVLLALVNRDRGLIFLDDASNLPPVRRLMGDRAADWVMITLKGAREYEHRLRRAFPGLQISVRLY